MRKVVSVSIPETSQPYNFDYFLTHYVFEPWVIEGKELVRLFKLNSGKFVLKRWGNWRPQAMLLLTTNTDTWAKNLGLPFRLSPEQKVSKEIFPELDNYPIEC